MLEVTINTAVITVAEDVELPEVAINAAVTMYSDAQDEDGWEDVIHVAVTMYSDAQDEDGWEMSYTSSSPPLPQSLVDSKNSS